MKQKTTQRGMIVATVMIILMTLTLMGAVGLGLMVAGTRSSGAQREAAVKFVEFMRSAPVQDALQTSMWMYADEPRTARPEVLRHAVEPAAFDNPSPEAIAAKGGDWVDRWTRVVVK